ncbi:hypothetical protein IB024_08015 [Brucella sp. 6810]|uniref:hypothetical protein n=1 Tax=Brucella sp. 6810 TaxID=2769351 RepID=UPI00165A8473|nr:hypothetical protein [Brucella sp. 6810]QNQ61618.1 hypothetical protein IB024_08015 [Brucella sp. 6810]
MSEWTPSEVDFAASLAAVQEYFARISPIVSLTLKPDLEEGFGIFLSVINDSENSARLEAFEQRSAKWKDILVNGILSHSRESLRITAYHAARISRINEEVKEALKDFTLAPNQSIGGGDMVVMNAEYQAFILSGRRCLDQLSYAISGLFKNECSSFRELGRFLNKQKKLHHYSDPLLSIYNRHEVKFHGWLLSRESRPSVRDVLAHTKSISVGTLNVNNGGIFFAGMDVPSAEFQYKNIADIVLELFDKIQACVNELVAMMAENLSHFLSSMTEVTE